MMPAKSLKNSAKLVIAVFSCMLLSVAAYAQEQPAPTQVEENTADVAITAQVEAKELKFEIVPNPDVKFPGTPAHNTEWSSERKNLPRPVEPGVTYRNIGITLKIVSVFADIDRIVDEALATKPSSEASVPEKSRPEPVRPLVKNKQAAAHNKRNRKPVIAAVTRN